MCQFNVWSFRVFLFLNYRKLDSFWFWTVSRTKRHLKTPSGNLWNWGGHHSLFSHVFANQELTPCVTKEECGPSSGKQLELAVTKSGLQGKLTTSTLFHHHCFFLSLLEVVTQNAPNMIFAERQDWYCQLWKKHYWPLLNIGKDYVWQ